MFTHLDEPLQTAWIGELRRVIKPSGHILITVNGVRGAKQLVGTSATDTPGRRARRLRLAPPGGENYCGAVHPDVYARNVLAQPRGHRGGLRRHPGHRRQGRPRWLSPFVYQLTRRLSGIVIVTALRDPSRMATGMGAQHMNNAHSTCRRHPLNASRRSSNDRHSEIEKSIARSGGCG